MANQQKDVYSLVPKAPNFTNIEVSGDVIIDSLNIP